LRQKLIERKNKNVKLWLIISLHLVENFYKKFFGIDEKHEEKRRNIESKEGITPSKKLAISLIDLTHGRNVSNKNEKGFGMILFRLLSYM